MLPRRRRALPPGPAPITRIERFQALEPGTYWRALRDVTVPDPNWPESSQTIDAGTVLLLLALDAVDDTPHTVVLRYHPLDGDGEYRLRVPAFLKTFELALDAVEVRAREMATLQKTITDLQVELATGQADPSGVLPAIAPALAAWEAEAQTAAATAGAPIPSPATVSPALRSPRGTFRTDIQAALDQRLGPQEVHALQHLAARQAKRAELLGQWIQERTDAIARTLEALQPFYAEQAGVALARTSDAQRQAAALATGLASLALYTGTGVEVETLSTGAPAPAGLPLTLCQRKLFIDEELAAWADVSATFDFTDVPTFDRLLPLAPALRDQIFPTPRCVVSMAVRRRDLRYADPLAERAANALNRRLFLLVRNGENFYRVFSHEPSHETAPRLFPTPDELDACFTGLDGAQITYEDIRYVRYATAAEQVARLYRRFLLLLCGLDHRLQLFGDFYDRREASQFLSLAFQQRHFQFLADDTPGRQLGTGRPPVLDWIRSHNAALQSGSRVLCVYHALLTPETAPACQRRTWSRRSEHDQIIIYARALVPHEVRVAYKDGQTLCVTARVRRESWRRLTQPEFDARVDLGRATRPSEDGFGFLCLDTVTAAEVEAYVHDREARMHHAEFIHLFKCTAAILRTEEAAEAAGRAWLRTALLEAGLSDSHGVDALLDASIRAWRCAHRGAPLPPADARAALTPILDHAYAACRQTETLRTRAAEYLTRRGHTPLRTVLTGRTRLGAYVEVPANERHEALMPWRWVRRLSLATRRTTLTEISSRLVWLRDQPDPTEQPLDTWPAHAAWVNPTPEPLRPTVLPTATRLVTAGLPAAMAAFRGPGAGIPPETFSALLTMFRERLRTGRRYVPHVTLSIPLAACLHETRERLTPVFAVLTGSAEAWLTHFGDAAQQRQVADVFIGTFRNQEFAERTLATPLHPTLGLLTLLPTTPLIVSGAVTRLSPETDDLSADLATWIRTQSTDAPRTAFHQVFAHPDVWDGTRVTLPRSLWLPTPPDPKTPST